MVSSLGAGNKAEIIFFDLLQEILKKLRDNTQVPSILLDPLALTASTVMHRLRILHKIVRLSRKQCHDILSTILQAFLEHDGVNYVGVSPTGDMFSNNSQSNSSTLKTHMYALLLHYLRYVETIVPQHQWLHVEHGEVVLGDGSCETNWSYGKGLPLPPSTSINSNQQIDQLKRGNLEILRTASSALLRMTTRDASDGITMELRTSALRALDGILAYDTDGLWIKHLEQRGFINCFVNAFHTLDAASNKGGGSGNGGSNGNGGNNGGNGSNGSNNSTSLPSSSSFSSPYEGAIHYFEATMILLNRIAMNKNGATILINYGVIDIMTLCPVLYTPEQMIASNNGNSNGRNSNNTNGAQEPFSSSWHRAIMPW